MIETLELRPLEKLTRDLVKASVTLGKDECRFLVDTYYNLQNYRIASNNQVRSIVQSDVDEPHETLKFFANQFENLENNIKRTLEAYAKSQPIGQWMLSITGIGPVITAGLIANLDITKAETAGAFWRFCGLDPNLDWLGREAAKKLVEEVVGNKKTLTLEDVATTAIKCNWGVEQAMNYFTSQDLKITKTNMIKYFSRCPYNQKMKTLMFKIGESFIKVQNNPNDVYGKIFVARKAYENAKNENLEYKHIADIRVNKVDKKTDAYKYYSNGMLPPAQIHARARRYAVKMFLSHLFDVWYRLEYKKEPPKPYAISILEHTHMIKVPNLEIIEN